MGDKARRSQRGNNNAYCQNNDTSWFDWNLLSKHADVLRFAKLLIERRMLRAWNMKAGEGRSKAG
jgi:isoamylase